MGGQKRELTIAITTDGEPPSIEILAGILQEVFNLNFEHAKALTQRIEPTSWLRVKPFQVLQITDRSLFLVCKGFIKISSISAMSKDQKQIKLSPKDMLLFPNNDEFVAMAGDHGAVLLKLAKEIMPQIFSTDKSLIIVTGQIKNFFLENLLIQNSAKEENYKKIIKDLEEKLKSYELRLKSTNEFIISLKSGLEKMGLSIVKK